jgi:cytochrome o ubiquinol oxidase subunit II
LASPQVVPRRHNWSLVAFALLTPLLLCGCDLGVMDPAGPVGHDQLLILIDSLAIMLVIIVPVLIAVPVFAWYFRATNDKAFYLPEWEFNGTIELVVWSIPLLTIVVLGGVAWYGSHALDPYKPLPIAKDQKPLEVQVVSMDWKWLFIYPEQGVAAVNQLYLPTGRPVHFTITSASVWNAFFVPRLGGMIYSMAGMTTQLNLQADKTGVFPGLSGMLSGDGFSDMHFDVHAVQPDDFTKWVDTAKASPDALDTAGYAKLANVSGVAEAATYKSADPNLFASIVNETAPAQVGPRPETNPP